MLLYPHYFSNLLPYLCQSSDPNLAPAYENGSIWWWRVDFYLGSIKPSGEWKGRWENPVLRNAFPSTFYRFCISIRTNSHSAVCRSNLCLCVPLSSSSKSKSWHSVNPFWSLGGQRIVISHRPAFLRPVSVLHEWTRSWNLHLSLIIFR